MKDFQDKWFLKNLFIIFTVTILKAQKWLTFRDSPTFRGFCGTVYTNQLQNQVLQMFFLPCIQVSATCTLEMKVEFPVQRKQNKFKYFAVSINNMYHMREMFLMDPDPRIFISEVPYKSISRTKKPSYYHTDLTRS